MTCGPARSASKLTTSDSYDEVAEDISKINAAGEISELAVVAEGEERTTWFVWLLVCCTSISGLLFGEPRSPRAARNIAEAVSQAMTPE